MGFRFGVWDLGLRFRGFRVQEVPLWDWGLGLSQASFNKDPTSYPLN